MINNSLQAIYGTMTACSVIQSITTLTTTCIAIDYYDKLYLKMKSVSKKKEKRKRKEEKDPQREMDSERKAAYL